MSVIYDLDNEYGGRIIGDGGESSDGVLKVVSADAGIPALNVARTTTGNASQAPFRIQGTSVASGALIGFGGGYISLTSVVLTTVANTDYAIPVEVGGVARYIPLFKAAALIGGATF